MRLAFSSAACPAWDLPAMVEAARRHGFAAIELAVPAGSGTSGGNKGLLLDRDSASRQLREAGVELVCLATPASLDVRDKEALSLIIGAVGESIAFARRLGCPNVRVYAGSLRNDQAGPLSRQRRESVLVQVSSAVRALVPHAVKHNVAILVENGGQFADSASLWAIVEAAGSPLVRCCWNPSTSQGTERSTTAIPRLGSKLGLIRLDAADMPQAGGPPAGPSAGASDTDIPRMIQLLRGINYQGCLLVDQSGPLQPPRTSEAAAADRSPPDPDKVLSSAAAYLKGLLEEKPVPLTAYKGDKFRPRQGHEFTAGH
jgi:sugar phosphate isomerase/epimerase